MSVHLVLSDDAADDLARLIGEHGTTPTAIVTHSRLVAAIVKRKTFLAERKRIRDAAK